MPTLGRQVSGFSLFIDKRAPELIFQTPHAVADRGLSDIQHARGSREATHLGEGCENAQQSEIRVRGHSCTMFIIVLKNNHCVHVNFPCAAH